MLTDVLVPHNRWDLLAPYPRPAPTVTVVVTHYEQHHLLDRMARALLRQTQRPTQVVLADDGSARPPALDLGSIATTVVRQEDRGFRAAAARNLAVRHSTGEILVFLDADTLPEPGCLAALTRAVTRCPDILAVGRRRHTSFAALDEHEDPGEATALPEPRWLSDAYTDSCDLLHADGRSFRFVISAVLACRRVLFDDIGGFDERFVGYGGEDWDLAYRAWNTGAVLVHEPAAVAWHDGPDWDGRDEGAEVMDQQSARLATVIPEPHTRGAPLPGHFPDVLVTVHPAGDFADTVRIVHSLLRQTHRDLGIHLPTTDDRLVDTYGTAIRTESWTREQRARARVQVDVHAPLPPDTITRAVDALVTADLGRVDLVLDARPVGTAWSTRALGRARRWSPRLTLDEVTRHAFGHRGLALEPTDDHARTLAGFFATAWTGAPV
jgi:glycosyl transferase family 2